MSLFKSIATFGGFTLISRITGFFRDMVLANFLGAGMISDAFFVAFKLPNLFRSLFAEGAFTSAFVPMLSQKLVSNGKKRTIHFAAQAISVLAFFVGIFVILMELLMPWVVEVLAPGFANDAGKIELATTLSRITFPFLLFISIVSFQSGILNSLGKFAAPASAPVILNVMMIISVFIFAPFGETPAHGIAVGITVAGFLEILWLSFFLHKQEVYIKPQINILRIIKLPDIRTLFKRIAPGILGAGIYQINMVVDSDRFKNLKKTQSKRYIAYCGTVTNFKDGVNVLLEAFAIVAKSVDDIDLYILGNTPYEKDRKQNMQIIQKNNLVDRVYMPGSVSAEILPQYLKNAEILALARPDNVQAAYGFPTKLGEYLLTGNPVVVTRVGELDNFLVDRESCLFANPNSAEDFADKLLWLLAHPNEGKQIGKNGKRVAESNFNSRIEAQKIIKVLNTLE